MYSLLLLLLLIAKVYVNMSEMYLKFDLIRSPRRTSVSADQPARGGAPHTSDGA